MNQENNILDRIGKREGMTVPEGFFENFAKEMAQKLPYRPEAEERQVMPHRTVWQRVRPYVYMAAMFAGIWCMLKMFTMMSPSNADLSIEKNGALTEALSDENFVYDYIENDINEREIFEEMFDDSLTVDEMMSFDDFSDDETEQM
jgi:hypothetical protein